MPVNFKVALGAIKYYGPIILLYLHIQLHGSLSHGIGDTSPLTAPTVKDVLPQAHVATHSIEQGQGRRAIQQDAAAADVMDGGRGTGSKAGALLPALPVPHRCLFILGTGRSGSTQLMDAVNQLPHYMVRGEQGGAFYHLWLASRQLVAGMRKSHDYTRAVEQLSAERRAEHEQAQVRERDQEQVHQDGVHSSSKRHRRKRQRRRGRSVLHQPSQQGHLGEGQGLVASGAAAAAEGRELEDRGGLLPGQPRRRTQQRQSEPASKLPQQGVAGVSRWLARVGEGEGERGTGATVRALRRRQAQEAAEGAGQARGWDESRLDFDAVKSIYDRHAPLKKLPWFNDFHPRRLTDAARAFYATLYAYNQQAPGGSQRADLVSGFKEIRFVSGRAFPPGSPYSDFQAFLGFLRSLCGDVKLLLNSRAVADLEANKKLAGMLRRFGHNVTADQLQADLLTTHDWYDRYAAEHPDHAMRVLMEHMFSEEEKLRLSERILHFLGEDPSKLPALQFDRMPSWGARTKGARGQEEDEVEDGEGEVEDENQDDGGDEADAG